MMPPLAMAPPMVAYVPTLVPVLHTLLVVVGEPLATATDVGVNEDHDFPRNGSYLLEVANAILDVDGRRNRRWRRVTGNNH